MWKRVGWLRCGLSKCCSSYVSSLLFWVVLILIFYLFSLVLTVNVSLGSSWNDFLITFLLDIFMNKLFFLYPCSTT